MNQSARKEEKMKRYLKSIHTRYMLTFMTIMILTILILGMIIIEFDAAVVTAGL